MRNKLRYRKKLHLLSHGFLLLTSMLLLLPIVFTFFYSFFPTKEMEAYLKLRGQFLQGWIPVLVSPKMVSLRQYYEILLNNTQYLQQFMNSVFYAVSILLGQALFVPAMAYALSRFKFKGRETIFFITMILMLMPFQVTLTPNVITLRQLGLMYTRWAVILPMWFSPFYIFLLRQFMVSVPGDMFEAGMMDGAGPGRSYFQVMLPICRPVIGAALALSFADSWNMFEQANTFLQYASDMPLSVAFNQITLDQSNIAFAGATLYLLPTLLIYFYFQEDILLGVQLSELK